MTTVTLIYFVTIQRWFVLNYYEIAVYWCCRCPTLTVCDRLKFALNLQGTNADYVKKITLLDYK